MIEQLLTEFLKEIVNGDPMERHTLVKKYATRLESMFEEERATVDKEDEERRAAYAPAA